MITFDEVREIGLTLPDVTEAKMYGSAALKVRGNLLACVPSNKSAEPQSVVFSIDFDLRAALVKANPEIYYVTEHYAGHPTVLARMPRMNRKVLREILALAWNYVSSKNAARGVGRRTRRTK